MKILFNHVLIRPDRANDEIILTNGQKLFLSTAYEKEKHHVCTARVVKAPEKLIFDREFMGCCLFDTDVEIQEGDHIIFHYLAIQSAREQFDANRAHIDPGLDIIPYDRIYVAYRDGVPVPVNGIILIEPLEETIKTTLIVPDIARKFSTTKGIVKYVSTPLRGYRDYPEEGPDHNDIQVGDMVLYREENCVPLEYSLHQKLDKGKTLYRMHRRDIDAVLPMETA